MKLFTKQEFDLATIQAQVFSKQQSRNLFKDDALLDRLIKVKDPAIRNFIMRRLKLLFDQCSKAVKEGKIPVEVVNRLSTFCLEIIPLIESEKIMMPTATELRILFDWYLNKQAQSQQKPAVILPGTPLAGTMMPGALNQVKPKCWPISKDPVPLPISG